MTRWWSGRGLGGMVLVGALVAMGACEEKQGQSVSDAAGLEAISSADAGAGGAVGSGGAPGSGGAGGTSGAAGGQTGGGPYACSDLFAQENVLEYRVDIAQDQWEELQAEFLVAATPGATLTHPYHPCVFHLGTETRTDAAIRLKGQSSWADTVQLDAHPKAQFVIAFDTVNTKASFHGVTKLVFDMPRMDRTFLRERMAQALLRDLGLPALCASSGKLFINGAYYGLYTTEEKWGGRVLKRVFPEAPNGELWKGGRLPEDSNQSYARRQAFWDAASSTGAMTSIIDLQQAVTQWAGEIVLNDGDGYYGGAHNFFIYDHPSRGFLWLSTDLDATYDWTSISQHPLFWWMSRSGRVTPGEHYVTVINDPVWRGRLVDAVASLLARTDVSSQEKRLDAWAAQIRDGVAADPHRNIEMATHDDAVSRMRAHIAQRDDYLRNFVECQRTGQGTDADGDGVPWCNDCNEGHPGASCY